MDTLTKELTAVWRKLGRMLGNGVPLLRAVDSIIKETASDQVRVALTEIKRAVDGGNTFHTALARHPGLFPPSALTLAHSGEMTGILEKSAMAIADGMADGSISLPAGAASAVSVGGGAAFAPDEAEATQLVSRIMAHAIEARATDIHLSTMGDNPQVRMRVDGVLTDKGVPAVERGMYPAVVMRIKVMAGIVPTEMQKIQDGRIMLSLRGREYDLRVNTTPCASGESLVLRILPKHLKAPTIAELDLPERFASGLKAWLSKPSGIVIVCGPTGSGKSTTLYSALQEVNVPGRKVMSVEDPVEYRIDGVEQVQVRPSQGITLRHCSGSCAPSTPASRHSGAAGDARRAARAVTRAGVRSWKCSNPTANCAHSWARTLRRTNSTPTPYAAA